MNEQTQRRKINFNLLLLGMTGSGKSQMNKRLLAATPRAIVLDRQAEYDDGKVLPFRSYDGAMGFYHRNLNDDWHIVFQGESDAEFLAVLDTVYETQRRLEARPVALFVDEASLYSTSHEIHPIVDRVYTKGRHGRISVVTSTQRLTQIHPIIRDQCHLWISFRLRAFPSEIREKFTQDDLAMLPTLKDLTPADTPTYGEHYVTDAGDVDIFGRWRRTLAVK